jgi:hypothetical protein
LVNFLIIEKPTHGRKMPYYAKRKTRIHRKAPNLAQEIHKLMRPDPHHQQCLKNVLDKTYFTWQKCKDAAAHMKHHTSPGASGISIDMLNLLPQNG